MNIIKSILNWFFEEEHHCSYCCEFKRPPKETQADRDAFEAIYANAARRNEGSSENCRRYQRPSEQDVPFWPGRP